MDALKAGYWLTRTQPSLKSMMVVDHVPSRLSIGEPTTHICACLLYVYGEGAGSNGVLSANVALKLMLVLSGRSGSGVLINFAPAR